MLKRIACSLITLIVATPACATLEDSKVPETPVVSEVQGLKVPPTIKIDERMMVTEEHRQFCEFYLKNVVWPEQPSLKLGWSYFPEDAKEAFIISCAKHQDAYLKGEIK